MGLKIKGGGNRPRINPAEGVYAAVICDVVDRGEKETEWQGVKKVQHKVSVHYLLEEKIPNPFVDEATGTEIDTEDLGLAGRQFGISQWFTASLHERGNLRKFLKKVLKRDLTEEEQKEVDIEDLLLGLQVQLVLVHNESNGTTYANVDTAIANPKGKVTVPDDYVRFQDREDNNLPDTDADDGDDEDDPLPF